MLSSGQDFSKKFLDSKHVLKVYLKPSRKKIFFSFLPLSSELVRLKILHLRLRDGGRSENMGRGGLVVMWGYNLPHSLVQIGLTELPKCPSKKYFAPLHYEQIYKGNFGIFPILFEILTNEFISYRHPFYVR